MLPGIKPDPPAVEVDVEITPDPMTNAEPGADVAAVEHTALPMSMGFPKAVRGIKLEP